MKISQAIQCSNKIGHLEIVFLYLVWESLFHHWEENKVGAPLGSSWDLATIEKTGKYQKWPKYP